MDPHRLTLRHLPEDTLRWVCAHVDVADIAELRYFMSHLERTLTFHFSLDEGTWVGEDGPWGHHLHSDGAAFQPQWQILHCARWAIVE
eukprot:5994565-Amphidinium_carterae.1